MNNDLAVLSRENTRKNRALGPVDNAIAYNRAGGWVTLDRVVPTGGRVRLLVRDSGPGLRADEMQRLFVPFERLSAEERGISGTGIGLALSKRMVEAMGGARTALPRSRTRGIRSHATRGGALVETRGNSA